MEVHVIQEFLLWVKDYGAFAGFLLVLLVAIIRGARSTAQWAKPFLEKSFNGHIALLDSAKSSNEVHAEAHASQTQLMAAIGATISDHDEKVIERVDQILEAVTSVKCVEGDSVLIPGTPKKKSQD